MYKYKVVFFLSFSILFYSCDNSVFKNDNPVFSLVTNVSGEIFEIPNDTKIVKAQVQRDFENFIIDSIFLDTTNFMLLNLDPLPQESQISIKKLFLPDTTIFISDENANVNYLLVYAFDSSNNFKGGIYKDNHVANPFTEGYFRVSYLYCDRTVRISGKSITVNGQDTNSTNYNIDLGIGWNALTIMRKIRRNNFIEQDFYNGEPEGGKWYFTIDLASHFYFPQLPVFSKSLPENKLNITADLKHTF